MAAAEGCLEAREFLAAEQRAPKLIDAIDPSFLWLLEPGNTLLRLFAPDRQQRVRRNTCSFQMAEIAVPRQMFVDILSLIAPPAPA